MRKGLYGAVCCKTESTTYSNKMSPSENYKDDLASISWNYLNSVG